MIIYIAGAMTGHPDWNRAAFDKAEQELSDQLHTVLSPASHIPLCNPDAIPHSGYMKISFAMIDCCVAVYMLNGWSESKGAQMERGYAINNGKVILYQSQEGAK